MSFTSDMKAYAEKAKRGFEDVVAESLVNLSSSVIVKTPILDGTLALSWRPTTAAPSTSSTAFSTDSTQLAAIEDETRLALEVGDYYLVNNQPYARRVEYDGWSDKAPRGMLRISVEEYQQFIDAEIAKLN